MYTTKLKTIFSLFAIAPILATPISPSLTKTPTVVQTNCDVKITQQDFNAALTQRGSYKITRPGLYCFSENITVFQPQQPVSVWLNAFTVLSADVTIDLKGFTLTNNMREEDYVKGIYSDKPDNLIVQNGTIRFFDIGLQMRGQPNTGTVLTTRSTIQNIHFLQDAQAIASGFVQVNVNNNIFEKITSISVDIGHAPFSTITHNTIIHDTPRSPSGQVFGFYISRSPYIAVTDNYFQNKNFVTTTAGIYLDQKSETSTIARNELTNYANSITISDSDQTLIEENYITDSNTPPLGNGIVVMGSQDVTLRRNKISNKLLGIEFIYLTVGGLVEQNQTCGTTIPFNFVPFPGTTPVPPHQVGNYWNPSWC